MSRLIKVAGVQHRRVVGDVDGNLRAVAEWTARAAATGARIVALPELSNTAYICGSVDDRHFALAEPIGGRTTQFYQQLAVEHRITLLGCLYERDSAHTYYNTALVVTPEGVIGRYRKTHIPSKPTFQEKYYFSPGNLGYPVFDLGDVRIGITICYDRHFPECYRHLALKGAEIVFSLNNTASTSSIRVWDSEMLMNAYCNGLFVVQVNATGSEGPCRFHGGSAIVAPRGEFVAHLGEEEAVVSAELDLDEMIAARRNLGSVRDAIWSDFGLDGTQSGHLAPGSGA
jgi:beta-ureidopropionase